jgi:hypothetical protein
MTPECIPKRQLYLSRTILSLSIPRQTRVYHRSLSLLGFILEMPCSTTNHDRYLVIYDNFTAYYHLSTDFHLCLCQDFSRHVFNMDYIDIRTHYQYAFQTCQTSLVRNLQVGSIIRVKKFGTQYHNARIIEQDCSIIKICFYERKSQPEMWLHCQSSIIERNVSNSNDVAVELSKSNFIDDKITYESDVSRLRKRTLSTTPAVEGTKPIACQDEMNE